MLFNRQPTFIFFEKGNLQIESIHGVTENAINRDPTVRATPDHRAIQRSLESGDIWSLVRHQELITGKMAKLRIRFDVLLMVRR